MASVGSRSLSYRQVAARSKLSMSFDYIFGRGTSKRLDLKEFELLHSRKTGRLRYVVDRRSKEILFTLRANGSIAPTILGARLMLEGRVSKSRPHWVVTVVDGVSEFVGSGKSVFCRHVAACDEKLRAGEDVVVSNQRGEILAVGKTVVSGSLIKQFKRGVAVKVREGASKSGSSAIV